MEFYISTYDDPRQNIIAFRLGEKLYWFSFGSWVLFDAARVAVVQTFHGRLEKL